jgi:CP family cyanate transporter-like MFS transporter
MAAGLRPGDLRNAVLLWLGGINLRLTMLAVPPVIPLIHEDLDLDQTMVGALNGLPTLLLAVAAVSGSLLIARVGARRALVWGLVVVGASSALRGAGPSTGALFAATFVMGAGIAMIQPAFPAIVRLWFPASVGMATAIYANGLLVGEILSAALTIPLVLPLVGGSWPLSFAVWAVPAVATAAAIALLAPAEDAGGGAPAAAWWPDWTSPYTWRIGLALAGSASLYFTTNAFIPDLLTGRGEPGLIGPALTALNVCQVPASLLMMAFHGRLTGRRAPLIGAAGLGAISVGGLILSSGAAAVAWSGAIGFAAAFGLVWTLALPPLVAAPNEVARLSAGIFTIGYAASFVTPLLGGILWDATATPALVAVPIGAALATTALSVLGLPLPRPSRPSPS